MSKAIDPVTQPRRFPAPRDGALSKAMLDGWRQDGFLVLEDFLSTATCDALLAQAEKLITQSDSSTHVVFSTASQAHAQEDYFLQSASNISVFYEESAKGAQDPKPVNKIGHALHDCDAVFDAVCRQPRLARLSQDLGLARPLLLQSMVIFKPPHQGGEVRWHQDESFLFTDPPSTIGIWFALADADGENGCLWAAPGAHLGPLREQFRRDDKGGMTMHNLSTDPWPEQQAIALPAKKGTVILLHGRLPHFSAANLSARPRPAFTLHLIDSAAEYSKRNWLQRSEAQPLRGFEENDEN